LLNLTNNLGSGTLFCGRLMKARFHKDFCGNGWSFTK